MLKEQLENAKANVRTESVQITVGEVKTLYEDGELNIAPDFQRLFRWGVNKKSAFIESLLVGIPTPPVFVFEKPDGGWELIDGLQRTSSVLEFFGVLRNSEGDRLAPRSVLTSTKYLQGLEGVVWEDPGTDETEMPKELKLFLRRSRLTFEVLKHPSDARAKYDLFQRLNRGGEYANAQEVRTCSMVMCNPEVTERIKRFATEQRFRDMFRVSPDQADSQKDIDYLVRILVHSSIDFNPRQDVEEFLNAGIVTLLEEGGVDLERVSWVLEILLEAVGAEAMIPNQEAIERNNYSKRFSLRALEGIFVGIMRNQESISQQEQPREYIRRKIQEFWLSEDVAAMSASGLRGTTRIQRSIPFGVVHFSPNA